LQRADDRACVFGLQAQALQDAAPEGDGPLGHERNHLRCFRALQFISLGEVLHGRYHGYLLVEVTQVIEHPSCYVQLRSCDNREARARER
jgi:hypothetical protein